jgi:predicted RND superfamily exporter protein
VNKNNAGTTLIDPDGETLTAPGARPWRSQLFARWLLRRPLAVCVCSLLLVLLAASGIPHLTLSGDYEVYFDDADPKLEELNRLYRVFSRNDNLLFAVLPRDGDVLQPRVLEVVQALTAEAWALPYSVRVDSITNYQHISSQGDEIRVAPLVPERVPARADELQRIGQALRGARALRNRLLSEDASATGINVQLELTGNRRLSVMHAARAARALAARFERAHPGIDVLLLRSLSAALFCFVVVLASSAAAMGLAGWLGFTITSASVAAPTIISTVAVADSMHLLSVLQRLRSRGVALAEAVTGTLVVNLRPIVITSVTTAIGFLSLNSSDSPPFRDLGNITAIGVMAALLISVVTLPALVALCGCSGRRISGPLLDLRRPACWLIRHRARLMLGVLALSAVCATLATRLELNDAFVEYFDERVEFRRDTDVIMQRLTGIYQLEYALPAGKNFGINEPDYLQVLDRFGQWLEAQPEVLHVNSITDVLKRLNEHVAGSGYRLPADREAAAQFLLLYEASVPYGLDLNARISVARDASRVTATLRNLDNDSLRDLERRAAGWLRDNAPVAMRAPATGAAILFAYIAQRNIQAMLLGGVLAVLVIAVALGFVFTSWRLGLASLLPNLVPAVIAFGLWTVLVGEMGIALAIVAAMTLGVVVDDTVHFISHALDARRRLRRSARAAVHHAFVTTGPALVSTSVVLVVGFSVLALSAYQVNHGMGQLTALVIVCALVADFAMLPWLLMHAARRGWI